MAEFGVGPNIVAAVWNLMFQHKVIPDNCTCKHFMWFLAYTRTYGAYEVYCTKFGTSKPNFVQKVHALATAVASLKDYVVSTVF